MLFGASTFFLIQDDQLFQIGFYQNMVGKGRKIAKIAVIQPVFVNLSGFVITRPCLITAATGLLPKK